MIEEWSGLSRLEWGVSVLGCLAVWQLSRIADHLRIIRQSLAEMRKGSFEDNELLRRDVREGAQQVAKEVQKRGLYRLGDR